MRSIALATKDGLPQYTPAEEKVHVISHLFGVVMGVCMVWIALTKSTGRSVLYAAAVFGVSLTLLYAASCVYHGIRPQRVRLKKAFRVIDHCSIFILIAGSSTPFTVCVLDRAEPQAGQFYNILIWALAAAGIVLLAVDLDRFQTVSILLYLVMGFSVLPKAGLLRAGIGEAGFALVIAGGAAYCIGLVLYSIKIRWTHAAFHVLCIVGSALHCACVYTCIF